MYKKFILSLVLIGLGCILFSFLTEDARAETMCFSQSTNPVLLYPDFQEVKTYLNNNIFWSLDYKRYQSSEWTNGNQYLSIGKTWDEGGFWKFTLTLTVPVNIYQGRFTFACNVSILQYVERDNHTLYFNYTSSQGNLYKIVFDYGDLKNISGLVFSHGLLNNHLWFRFMKQNINAGTYVFDPTVSLGEYNTQNGYGYVDGANWGASHHATAYSGSTQTSVVADCSNGWRIYRGFLFFDTSSLPDVCTISSATLSLTNTYVDGSPDRYCLVVDTNSPYYPQTSMDGNDFDISKYDSLLFVSPSISTTGLRNETLTVNTTFNTFINKTGISRCMVMEYTYDYLDVSPTPTWHGFGFDPEENIKLWITYSTNIPPTIKNIAPVNSSLLNVNATILISYPYITFTINDSSFPSENVSYVVKCNASGTWSTLFNGFTLANATKTFLFDDYTYKNRTFWINITVSDTLPNTVSAKRHFYVVNVSSVSSGTPVDNSSDDWVWVSDFSLDTGELGLSIVFILFSLVFVIKRPEDMVWKPILLFINTPIAIATGIFYLSGNTMFSTTWFIGVIIFLFGVLLSFGGLYYSLSFGRGNRD